MFTVLGAKGFIGSRLAESLKQAGEEVYCPERNESLTDRELGHVFYCIGVTSDFRRRPFDTVQAHVCELRRILVEAHFDSLLYLSSTRVYSSGNNGDERATLQVTPAIDEDLYNISKLMGESLCMAAKEQVRVVRLSNVFGYHPSSDTFLHSIVTEALTKKRIRLRSALDSEKDYVSIEDVVALLPRISLEGKRRIYNIASGRNTTHAELLKALAAQLGIGFDVDPDACSQRFPRIAIDRIKQEFGFKPVHLLNALPELLSSYRK